jgi:hypothetical protein
LRHGCDSQIIGFAINTTLPRSSYHIDHTNADIYQPLGDDERIAKLKLLYGVADIKVISTGK